MPTYHLSVTDSTGNTILAAVTISTYPCNQNGTPSQSSVPPTLEGWAVTWANTGGAAASHAPVFSSAATQSLVFSTEDAAYQAARVGVYNHYTDSLQQNVRLVS